MFSPSLTVASSSPLVQSLHRSALIQASVFHQSQEDVIASAMVRPGDATTKASTFGLAAAPVLLVLTVTRTRNGYREPKLHHLKIKGPTKWSAKSFRLLKTIERLHVPADDALSFSYMTAGDGRRFDWHVTSHDAGLRDDFLWWLLHSIRLFNKAPAAQDVDEVTMSNLLARWARVASGAPEPAELGLALTATQRDVVAAAVAADREGHRQRATLQSTSAEGAVALPSLSAAEAEDIEYFLRKFGDAELLAAAAASGGVSSSSTALTVAGASAGPVAGISAEGWQEGWLEADRLEAALQTRLAEVERESARSIFTSSQSPLHQLLAELLGEAGEALEEVGVWAAAHDASLTRMGVGVEKIEARSEALEAEDRNHSRLHAVLESFLDEVLLSDDVIKTLKNPDFDGDLDGVLDAVSQLTTVLQSKRLNPPNAAETQAQQQALLVTGTAAAKAKAAAAAAAAKAKAAKAKAAKAKRHGAFDDDDDDTDSDDGGFAGAAGAGRAEALTPFESAALDAAAAAPANAAASAAAAGAAGSSATSSSSSSSISGSAGDNGAVSLAGLSNTHALRHQRQLYAQLQLSFTALASDVLRRKIDELAKWGAEKHVSAAQARAVASGGPAEVLAAKLEYKLSKDKYRTIHTKLVRYKRLIALLDQLAPGTAAALANHYAGKVKPLYDHDVESLTRKLKESVVGSSVDCRLRSCPEITLAKLRDFQMASVQGQARARLQAAPAPAGKLLFADAVSLALERVFDVAIEEQSFFAHCFGIDENALLSVVDTPLAVLRRGGAAAAPGAVAVPTGPAAPGAGVAAGQLPSTLQMQYLEPSAGAGAGAAAAGGELTTPASASASALVVSDSAIAPAGAGATGPKSPGGALKVSSTLSSHVSTLLSRRQTALTGLVSRVLSSVAPALSGLLTVGAKSDAFSLIRTLGVLEGMTARASPAGAELALLAQGVHADDVADTLAAIQEQKDSARADARAGTAAATAGGATGAGKKKPRRRDGEDDGGFGDLSLLSLSSDSDDTDSDSDGDERKRGGTRGFGRRPAAGKSGFAVTMSPPRGTLADRARGGPGVGLGLDERGLAVPATTNFAKLYSDGFRVLAEDKWRGAEHVVVALAFVQAHLKVTWNAFVEGEIAWVNDYKANVKQNGVFSPFARLPAFIEMLEAAMYPSRSEAADLTYSKLSVCLLHWVVRQAAQTPKYENVSIMENAHYFCCVVGGRMPRLTGLTSCLQMAKKMYLENRAKYVQWNIEYAMPEATAFWTKLAAELRSNPSAPTEAAFFPGLSKAHLRSVLKDSYNRSKIGIAAQSMYGRLKRHLPTNATLANDLFLLVKDAFLTTSQAFEATANAVYPHEKLGITLAEINAIFDRILPPDDDNSDPGSRLAPSVVTGMTEVSVSRSLAPFESQPMPVSTTRPLAAAMAAATAFHKPPKSPSVTASATAVAAGGFGKPPRTPIAAAVPAKPAPVAAAAAKPAAKPVAEDDDDDGEEMELSADDIELAESDIEIEESEPENNDDDDDDDDDDDYDRYVAGKSNPFQKKPTAAAPAPAAARPTPVSKPAPAPAPAPVASRSSARASPPAEDESRVTNPFAKKAAAPKAPSKPVSDDDDDDDDSMPSEPDF